LSIKWLLLDVIELELAGEGGKTMAKKKDLWLEPPRMIP
jgi:hypothetical protein